MKKEEIHLDDIRRLLLGQTPPEFLLEVLLRSIVLYVAVVIIVRLLGKRTNAQLTITEKAVFITLGAIIALPMQGATTGILVGIVLLITLLFLQRTLTLTYFYSAKWEQIMQGKERILVRDSVIDIKELESVKISREQLFEILRNKEVRQLGQVKRVYLEPCGTFSIYNQDRVKPGLPIIPKKDHEDVKDSASDKVCTKCGYPDNKAQYGTQCPNCNNTQWINASKEFTS